MAEDKRHQQFTNEQLDELRFGDMVDVIPGVGILAIGGRKVLSEIIESIAPYVKKAGLVIKDAVGEVRDFYVKKQSVREVAHDASINALRNDLKPLAEVYKEGVDIKKLDPVAFKKMKGADLFVNKEHDLLDYLGEENFHKYAQLAIEDEKIYRKTLSAPDRLLRAVKYDNFNPELGSEIPYWLAPLRIGGSNNTILATATAGSVSNEMKIMALSYLRGGIQTGAIGVGADATISEVFHGIQAFKSASESVPEKKDTSKPESHGDEEPGNVFSPSVEQKVAFINRQIGQLPEHQQHVMREQVASYRNDGGMHIEEVGPSR